MIIKVCGLTRPDNVAEIAALDIHWLGFIFWPPSKRYCTLPDGQIAALAPGRKKVGVFVNATSEEMHAKATACRLDYLQLHGNESPAICRAMQELGHSVIKAFPIADESDLSPVYAYEGCADYFLFDTKSEGYGGSGRTFDWAVLRAYSGATPFIISGGLNPGNIEAVRRFAHVRFAGIDLNSGFESEPGVKDVCMLRAALMPAGT